LTKFKEAASVFKISNDALCDSPDRGLLRPAELKASGVQFLPVVNKYPPRALGSLSHEFFSDLLGKDTFRVHSYIGTQNSKRSAWKPPQNVIDLGSLTI
jgi:hypothetical protein